ncbi:MAG: hypothetical protein JSS34_06205 [Proteobacteria bacterium]|nr:hypothetical protein [Pseudomonadota bacterium]
MILLRSILTRLLIGFLLAISFSIGLQAVTWEEMTPAERDLPGAIFRRVKSLTTSFEDLRNTGAYGIHFKTEEKFLASRGEYFNDMFLKAHRTFVETYDSILRKEDLSLCDNPEIGNEYKTHIRDSITRLYNPIQEIFASFHADLLPPGQFSRANLETWFNRWFKKAQEGGNYVLEPQLEALNRIAPGQLSDRYRPYFFLDYGTSSRAQGSIARAERPAFAAASPLNVIGLELKDVLPSVTAQALPTRVLPPTIPSPHLLVTSSAAASQHSTSHVATGQTRPVLSPKADLGASKHAPVSATPVMVSPSQTRVQFLESSPGKFYDLGLTHKRYKLRLTEGRPDRDEHINLLCNKFSIPWARVMLGEITSSEDLGYKQFLRRFASDVNTGNQFPLEAKINSAVVLPILRGLSSSPLDHLFEIHHLERPTLPFALADSDLRVMNLFKGFELGEDFKGGLATLKRHNFISEEFQAVPHDLFLKALTYLCQIHTAFPNDEVVKTLVAQAYGLILDQNGKCARGLFGRSFLLTEAIAQTLVIKLDTPFQR